MLLVVHAIAGATVGASIANPLISAPIAFATHFVLDSFPHWNYPVPKRRTLPAFWRAFGPDMVLSVVVGIALILWFRTSWANVLWGIGWACVPDFLTLYRKKKPWSIWFKGYFELHNRVQWEVAKGPGLAVQSFLVLCMGIILLMAKGD